MLDGFEAKYAIPVKYPIDIRLFTRNRQESSIVYAVTLDCGTLHCPNLGEWLAIYKFLEPNTFVQIHNISTERGRKIEIHPKGNLIYLVIIEENSTNSTGVFELDNNDELHKIQTLNIPNANDLHIWEDFSTMYMAVAVHRVNSQGDIIHEAESSIYKWLGKHFDLYQQIKTFDAKRIAPFTIGGNHFLAVANHKNNDGKTNIFSDVYKYDLNTKMYVIHQKLATKAATDMKYFSLRQNNAKEHFLIVANFYETEHTKDINYQTKSIVYKYVDGYFIPFQSFNLNATKKWLPVEGPDGEFILLAICSGGIKIFQYDGWRFIEIEVQFSYGAFGPGVETLHSYNINNKIYVGAVNKYDKGNMINVFQPIFTQRNVMVEFEQNLEKWCLQTLRYIENEELQKVIEDVENAPTLNGSDILLIGNVTFNNVTIEKLFSNETDNSNENFLNETELKKIKVLQEQVDSHLEKLDDTHNPTAKIYAGLRIKTLNEDVFVEKITLESDNNVISDIKVKYINNRDVLHVLNNTLDINSDIVLNASLQFESLKIEDELITDNVNGQNVNNTSQTVDAATIVENLYVDGEVIFEKGLKVDGYFDGIKFDRSSIVTTDDNQILKGKLNTTNVVISNLFTNTINNVYVDTEVQTSKKLLLLDTVENLTVANFFVRGYLNNIDVRTLQKYGLKISGDQMLHGDYDFDSLYVKNLEINSFLSNKRIPDDLVLVTNGTYDIKQDVKFSGEVFVDNLDVEDRINSVSVINGTLDVLLNNSTRKQYIDGFKEFENLQILNPIKLQGKITSNGLKKMQPVATIEEEISLNGDYKIFGDVTIEEFIQSDDVFDKDQIYSLRRMDQFGFKLDEVVISKPIKFSQALNVDSLTTDKFNNAAPESWVITNSNKTQVIFGSKTFSNNVHVTKSVKTMSINDVNIEELNATILKIKGEQIISGHHTIEQLSVNRITSNDTKFGLKLADILTLDQEQIIKGTAIVNGIVKVEQIDTTELLVNNKLNGVNFNSLIADVVLNNSIIELSGLKEFRGNLTVEKLKLSNGFNLDDFKDITDEFKTNSTYIINQSIVLNKISVANIIVDDNFFINDISSNNFGKNWLLKDSNPPINGEVTISNLKILEPLLIRSGEVNNINLQEVSANSVKLNESFNFTTINMLDGAYSSGNLLVNGKMGDIHLLDMFEGNMENEVNFAKHSIFRKSVTIDGELITNGLISNRNLSELCNFAFPKDSEKVPHLIINGSAYFKIGPKMKAINDVNIRDILQNAWFSNVPSEINGRLEFDNVIFNNKLFVNNLVNGVDLQWLSNNYFSKTKDQTVVSVLNFTSGIIFEQSLYVPNIKVSEKFSGMNLNEFVQTALINKWDQVFESTLNIEICTFLDISGNYTVNSFNLGSDLLRYDVQHNLVSGKKLVQTISTNILNLPSTNKLQNVYLYNYLITSIKKHQNSEISGYKVFKNESTFKHIGIKGLFNGIKFNQNNIMFKSLPQLVTGMKIFSDATKTLYLKTMGLLKRLNDIDINTLLYNQIYNDNNNYAISSPMLFSKNITTESVNFINMYNNVNITTLIYDIENNIYMNDYKGEYALLANKASNIKESLGLQAYYLKNYMETQIFNNVTNIAPIDFNGNGSKVLAVLIENKRNNFITFYRWNESIQKFVVDSTINNLNLSTNVTIMQSVTMSNKDYLYMEALNNLENFDISLTGKLYGKTEANNLQLIQEIKSNDTISLTPVVLPGLQQNCLVFIYFANRVVNIYCEDLSMRNGTIYLHQQINLPNSAIQATNTIVENIPYIIIANNKDSVDIWKYDTESTLFVLQQIIPTAGPISITSKTFNEESYIAIASGHVKNAMDSGIIDIRRFNHKTDLFETKQQISIRAPSYIEFMMLPTNELVLYALTNSPTEPFIVYLYEGVNGFVAKVTKSPISQYEKLQAFTVNRRHFLILSNEFGSRIIQADFYSQKHV